MDFEREFYSNGIPLASTICLPDGDHVGKKYPTIILCHGHSRNRNDGLDRLAEVLSGNGFASIRFDFRGCGDAAVNKYHLYIASEMPDDLINAISFAESLPFVDTDRLGVAGISLGAIIALYVSGSGEDRIKSVVAMSGTADCLQSLKDMFARKGGDWDAFLNRVREDAKIAAATGKSQIINRLEMFCEDEAAQQEGVLESMLAPGNSAYLSLDSVANFIRFKPIEKCENIQCPVYFIHGEEDELISPKNSQSMFEKVKQTNKKLKIYPGVDHNIPISKDREMVFKDIVEWFVGSL